MSNIERHLRILEKLGFRSTDLWLKTNTQVIFPKLRRTFTENSCGTVTNYPKYWYNKNENSFKDEAHKVFNTMIIALEVRLLGVVCHPAASTYREKWFPILVSEDWYYPQRLEKTCKGYLQHLNIIYNKRYDPLLERRREKKCVALVLRLMYLFIMLPIAAFVLFLKHSFHSRLPIYLSL